MLVYIKYIINIHTNICTYSTYSVVHISSYILLTVRVVYKKYHGINYLYINACIYEVYDKCTHKYAFICNTYILYISSYILPTVKCMV